MKAGDKVVQRLPAPIKGEIVQRRFNDEDDLMFLVAWTDKDGNPQQRWFLEEELQADGGAQ